jgi:hypothetical protein
MGDDGAEGGFNLSRIRLALRALPPRASVSEYPTQIFRNLSRQTVIDGEAPQGGMRPIISMNRGSFQESGTSDSLSWWAEVQNRSMVVADMSRLGNWARTQD